MKNYYYLVGLIVLILIQACALPTITKRFPRTKQSNLPPNIQAVQFKDFTTVLKEDVLEQDLAEKSSLKVIQTKELGGLLQNLWLNKTSELEFSPENTIDLQPTVLSSKANQEVNGIVQATISSHFSKRSTYALLSTNQPQQGSLYAESDVAVIQAKVYYFEQSFTGHEALPYSLLVFNESSSLNSEEKNFIQIAVEKAAAIALESGFRILANGATKDSPLKGVYLQDTPYIETVAGLKIELKIVQKNNQKNLLNMQASHWVNLKWGGKVNSSHVPVEWRSDLPLQFFPDNASTSATSLEIKTRLANLVAEQLMEQLFSFSEESEFKIANGDSVAQTYLRAGAFLHAVNHLNDIDREPDDDYNLALAHQALGNNSLAVNYYVSAIDRDSKNLYKESLSNLLDWLKNSSTGSNNLLIQKGLKALK